MHQGGRHRAPRENRHVRGLQTARRLAAHPAPPERTNLPATVPAPRRDPAPSLLGLRLRARDLGAHHPHLVAVMGSVGLLGFVGSCLLFASIATLDPATYLALSAASLTLYTLALFIGYLADPYVLQRAPRTCRDSDRSARRSGIWRKRAPSA